MQALKSEFLLRTDVTYLNHGSFGATPKEIFDSYQQFQLELEQEPVLFIVKNGMEYLKKSREALAAFIHCQPDDVVYVVNPSHAINIVAKSLPLYPGDEVLSTDLEYGALDRTWNYYCKKAGAKYVRQPIELPITSKEAFIENFFRGLTTKTKAIFISHLTSSTALKFPVEEICRIAKSKGLITIVDGAHIPNQFPLDLSTIQVDVYTGACHKWMLTPKGSSFLYVTKEYQNLFDPLVVSWGYQAAKPSSSRFLDYHQTQGTRDFSSFLTIPKAIEYIQKHQWSKVAAQCRQLAHSNYMRFCDLLETIPLAPVSDEYLGQMCSIPLQVDNPEKLHDDLLNDYQIEIPVMPHADRTFIRYSINAYNDINDLDKLYQTLKELKSKGIIRPERLKA